MKKRLKEIFYLFSCGVNDLSHLVVLIIFKTINVLSNDSRRTMPFVASVPFTGSRGDVFVVRTSKPVENL